MDLEKIKGLFINWTKRKICHHISGENSELYFREKEVWWVAFGKNIGYEINGKQELFERPAVIIKKYNENMCFVIPFTTKIRRPLPWFHVSANFGVEPSVAVISQGRTISPKRLLRKEAVLEDKVFNEIIKKFKKQFK